MKLRPLIENPFRNYAVFSGRAGRAEFWLFILTFVVITQLAWLLGFGVMKIAGFDRDHDGAPPHHMMGSSEYGDLSRDDADNMDADNMSADRMLRTDPDHEGWASGKYGGHHFNGYHSDRRHDDRVSFMIHRHGRDGYHLHGIIRDDHILSYGQGGLDDEDARDRYEHRGHGRDRHVYVKFHKSRAERTGDILWMISVAALLLPLLAVGARRLHDSNHSGWWQLLGLVPLAGWLVLVIFFLLPGDETENRHGAPPQS